MFDFFHAVELSLVILEGLRQESILRDMRRLEETVLQSVCHALAMLNQLILALCHTLNMSLFVAHFFHQ